MSDTIRVTPRILPFRRAGIVFAARDPIFIAQSSLSGDQQHQLANEPQLVAEVSSDGGATWTPFVAPWPVAQP